MQQLRRFSVGLAIAAAAALARGAHAQQARPSGDSSVAGGSVTVVPGAAYAAGGFKRFIFGSGWRDLWTTPVTVPPFDIDTFAGGLKVDKRGGGFQSVTLHLTEQNGWQEWRFRSVDKYPELNLPPALKGSWVGSVIEDQTGNLFPAAGLATSPFMRSIGALFVPSTLHYMKDKERLGEHRELFAGMLGTVELKPNEAPEDKPGFAGSMKVKDTDGFFEELSASQANRIDEREFLAVRLIDFLINDTDRTPDNLDWARFVEDGDNRWRPIARDRDRAFTDGSGLVNKLFVQRVYPKFSTFNTKFAMRGLMSSSYIFDRRLLQRLTRKDFADVAREVQKAVTDEVIDEALGGLPAEWRARTETMSQMRATLRARRDGLSDAAMRFYLDLATHPDVRLTADSERAEIVRHANGDVTVTVNGVSRPVRMVAEARNADGTVTRVSGGEIDRALPPFYARTFSPAETQEIRVYLGKGNDTAVVRGAGTDSIVVRVIGEAGDDVLADSVAGGAEYFYDAEGNDRFLTDGGTRVSRRAWSDPPATFGFTLGGAWRPDWGFRHGWHPVVKYGEGNGLIIGAGPRITMHGFRRLPYEWRANAALLVGTGNGRLGVIAEAAHLFENSPLGVSMTARATQLSALRFYGYGNDTPDIGRDLSLVQQTLVSTDPALVWNIGWRTRENTGSLMQDPNPKAAETKDTVGRRAMIGRLRAGPLFVWSRPEPAPGAPLVVAGERSGFMVGGAGFSADLDATDRDPVPMNGWRFRGNVAGYPLGLNRHSFATGDATASLYVPLIAGSTMAFRAGGAVTAGDTPALFGAAIGGSSTVRGYSWHRFTGDRSASASTEVRVPVGRLNFLVRSDVGVIALADAGRVWFDGRSSGGWHTGVGGGLWFAALGRALSVTFARGDENRLYLKTGLPF
jgi:hypothetical protein